MHTKIQIFIHMYMMILSHKQNFFEKDKYLHNILPSPFWLHIKAFYKSKTFVTQSAQKQQCSLITCLQAYNCTHCSAYSFFVVVVWLNLILWFEQEKDTVQKNDRKVRQHFQTNERTEKKTLAFFTIRRIHFFFFLQCNSTMK